MKRATIVVFCFVLILMLAACVSDYDTGYSDGYKSALNDVSPGEYAPPFADYVLNTNTKKFHYPDCSSVDQMSDKNKFYFSGAREEVIEMGYSPCGRCNP